MIRYVETGAFDAILTHNRYTLLDRSAEPLLDLAATQGLARVTLSAQTHAVGFYETAGFHVIGEEFMDAGITHRQMVKELLLPQAGPERR